MKKLFLTAGLCAGLLFGAKAQIQKGNVFVGASLSDISFGLDKPNTFSFNINPKAAWFVQDGLAIGGEVDFGLTTQKGAEQVSTMALVLWEDTLAQPEQTKW